MAEKYHRPRVRYTEPELRSSMGYMSEYRVSCACGWERRGGFDTEQDALACHAKHVKKARGK